MEYIRGDLVEEISETRVWCKFKNCDRGPAGKSPGMSGQDCNIRRHYKTHGFEWPKRARLDESESERERDGTVLIPTKLVTEEQYWNNILAMHRELNLPLSAWNCEALRINQLPYTTHFETTISSETVKQQLNGSVMREVQKDLGGKLFSLKFDIAKSELAVSVQYIKDWQIVVRHLGEIELKESHSAEMIKSDIDDYFCAIGLDTKKIYSVTTDQGRDKLDDTQEQPVAPVVLQAEKAIRQFSGPKEDLPSCARVIQLAINDFLAGHREKVAEVQKKAKETFDDLKKYSPDDIREIEKLSQWTSTFEMMKNLIAVPEDIFDEILDWSFVGAIHNELLPANDLMVKLQNMVQYTIGDFAFDNYKCLYYIRKYTNGTRTLGSEGLEHELRARQPLLFKKIHFLAALYLDPRFNNKDSRDNNQFLSKEDKARCVDFLVKLSERLENSSEPASSSDSCRSSPLDSMDENLRPQSPSLLDIFHLEMYGEHRPSNSTTRSRKIIALEHRDRVDLRSFDVLKYWKAQAHRDPEMAIIAAIVLATPATVTQSTSPATEKGN